MLLFKVGLTSEVQQNEKVGQRAIFSRSKMLNNCYIHAVCRQLHADKTHPPHFCQKCCTFSTNVNGEENPLQMNSIYLTIRSISLKYKVINYGLKDNSNGELFDVK